MQPFSFFFIVGYSFGGGGGGGEYGSGSKFNCAARVGSGWVRRSRVRAGFGLQFWARAGRPNTVCELRRATDFSLRAMAALVESE